jgi:hypothetical protein
LASSDSLDPQPAMADQSLRRPSSIDDVSHGFFDSLAAACTCGNPQPQSKSEHPEGKLQ